MCSVPPSGNFRVLLLITLLSPFILFSLNTLYIDSGNGPMTIRFCLRNVFQALKIVWGFVFKAATTNADLSRELFFDDELDNEASKTFSF